MARNQNVHKKADRLNQVESSSDSQNEIDKLFDEDGEFMPKKEQNQEKETKKEIKAQIEKDAKIVKEELDTEFSIKWRSSMIYARCKHQIGEEHPTIHFGTDNGIIKNLKVARFVLVHEAIHAAGKSHNKRSRAIGYYSSFKRDTYTNEKMREIGWEVPTDKMIDEAIEKSYEYRVYCPKCDFEMGRASRCSTVRKPERYECPECGAKLKSGKW